MGEDGDRGQDLRLNYIASWSDFENGRLRCIHEDT